jgi:hypothetical protein
VSEDHGLGRDVENDELELVEAVEVVDETGDAALGDPQAETAADDETRFADVTSLGVDEHIVRHEALLYRMEVGDLHWLAVVAAK